jgi:hypothetical protein
MIGPSVQQKVDCPHTEMAEVERLIGIQDEADYRWPLQRCRHH